MARGWILWSSRTFLSPLQAPRAASGAATWPGGSSWPFARTSTGDAIRAKSATRCAPLGQRIGGRSTTKTKAISNTAPAAPGSGSRLGRSAFDADVSHSLDTHNRRNEIGCTLIDHLLDRRGVIYGFDSHPGHTIP